MNYIQTYESFLDIPHKLLKLINKIGDRSIFSKVKNCLINLKGMSYDEAFEYMCEVFGKRPDKNEFMSLLPQATNESIMSNIIERGKIVLFFIGLFLVLAFLRLGLESSYKDEAIDFLRTENVTNITITGSDPFAERDDDVISLTFEGERNGKRVSGVVIVGGSALSSNGNTYQVKYYSDGFLNESWSKILFGKSVKEIWDDIYSEINPILKLKKMKKYHQKLKDDVDRGQKELEEKRKIVQDLETKIKDRIKNR
jgi:hypothetical protein